MDVGLARFPSSPNVDRFWLLAAERAQSVVGGLANQRFEAETDRVGIALGAARGPGIAEQGLIDMQGLLHAIRLWPDRMA